MVQFLFVIQLLFIGTTELLLIGGIALLLFGGKKLPEMMHGLGQGVREFKKGVNEDSKNPNVAEKQSEDVENDKQEEGQNAKNSHIENGE